MNKQYARDRMHTFPNVSWSHNSTMSKSCSASCTMNQMSGSILDLACLSQPTIILNYESLEKNIWTYITLRLGKIITLVFFLVSHLFKYRTTNGSALPPMYIGGKYSAEMTVTERTSQIITFFTFATGTFACKAI